MYINTNTILENRWGSKYFSLSPWVGREMYDGLTWVDPSPDGGVLFSEPGNYDRKTVPSLIWWTYFRFTFIGKSFEYTH